MVVANPVSPGMTISLEGKLYRVESSTKVAAKAGTLIKTKLRDLLTDEIIEKNFKSTQKVQEVVVSEKQLEFLYLEGKEYLFLDIEGLERIPVSPSVVGDRVDYLKEGIQLKAVFYGETVFSVELPPFLELNVGKIEEKSSQRLGVSSVTKTAVLETGARIEVPPFVEVGDLIKVDTKSGEFIQRV